MATMEVKLIEHYKVIVCDRKGELHYGTSKFIQPNQYGLIEIECNDGCTLSFSSYGICWVKHEPVYADTSL